MKGAVGALRSYDTALRQVALVRPELKYDNRGVAARSLELWALAHKPLETTKALDAELPGNEALELLAEGYAAALDDTWGSGGRRDI